MMYDELNEFDSKDERNSLFVGLRLSLVFFLLLATLTASTYAQDGWEQVPSSADFAVIIHRPDQLADVLLDFISDADEPPILDLVTSEPHPLLARDDYEKVLAIIRERIKSIESSSRVTFFATASQGRIDYCALLEFTDAKAASGFFENAEEFRRILDWLGTANPDQPAASNSQDPSESDGMNSEPTNDALLNFCLKSILRFHPTEIRDSGRSLIISNSASLKDWAVGAHRGELDTTREDPIIKNRRFLRARFAGSRRSDLFATAYLIPSVVLPMIDSKKYTAEYLETLGYSELVGAWCELGIFSRAGRGTGFRMHLTVSVPHTEPPLGITEYWKCTAPIQTVPDVRKLWAPTDAQPAWLSITSTQRKDMLESLRKTYEAQGKSLEYRKLELESSRWVANVEHWRNYFDGYKFELGFHVPEIPTRRLWVCFMHHEHFENALAYVRTVAETENKEVTLKKEAVRFGEFEGWYLSPENARRQAIMDGIKEADANATLIRNMGMVAMPNWILVGDRFIAEKFTQNQPDMVDVNQVFEDALPELPEFLNRFQPWWIEVWWPDSNIDSVLTDLRLAYFGLNSNSERPLRMLRKHPLGTAFPVASRSDRLFQVIEPLIRRHLGLWGADVRAFASRDGYFQWTWRNMDAPRIVESQR